MTTRLRPPFARFPQRDSLRHRQSPALPSRSAGRPAAAPVAEHGSASDSVFKRLPAIGETPATPTLVIHG